MLDQPNSPNILIEIGTIISNTFNNMCLGAPFVQDEAQAFINGEIDFKANYKDILSEQELDDYVNKNNKNIEILIKDQSLLEKLLELLPKELSTDLTILILGTINGMLTLMTL